VSHISKTGKREIGGDKKSGFLPIYPWLSSPCLVEDGTDSWYI